MKLKEPDQAKKSWTKALDLLKVESNPDEDLLKQLQEKLGIKEDTSAETDPTDKK